MPAPSKQPPDDYSRVPPAPDLPPVNEQPLGEEMVHQGDGAIAPAHGKKVSFTIGSKKLPLKKGNIEDLRITHLILPQSIGDALGWQTRDDESTDSIIFGNRIEDVSLDPQSESEQEVGVKKGNFVYSSFAKINFQPVKNIFSFQKKFKILRRYSKISMMEAKKSFSPNQMSDFQSESKGFNYFLEGPFKFKPRYIKSEPSSHSWGKVGRAWKPFRVRFINTVKSLEGEDEVPLQTAATILLQSSKSNPTRVKDLRVDGRLLMRRW